MGVQLSEYLIKANLKLSEMEFEHQNDMRNFKRNLNEIIQELSNPGTTELKNMNPFDLNQKYSDSFQKAFHKQNGFVYSTWSKAFHEIPAILVEINAKLRQSSPVVGGANPK